MSENRDIAGIWWLPENPTDRWLGTLKLAPGRSPQLKFTVETSSNLCSVQFPEVLHGCDQHGHPITLLKLGRGRASFSGALAKLSYSAGYAILGIELLSRDNFHAHTLTLYMQHLFEWMARSGFQHENMSRKEGTIRYLRPEVISFAVGNDLMVKIVATSSSWSAPRERGIREHAFLEFYSAKGFSFMDCDKLVTAIRHLLHFAILQPVYPTRITCSQIGGDIESGNSFSPQEIEICSALNREQIESEFQAEGWMFQFSDVQSAFGQFLDKWLTFLRKFDEAMGCYFTTIYHPLPDVVQHICLTQALVAFHGIKNQSLGSYGLENQIRELAEVPGASMPGLFDDASGFAKSVAATRHYNTHFNPADHAKGVVSGTPLFRVNEKLKLLFQICVLTEMGIASERFPRLRRQLATHIVEY